MELGTWFAAIAGGRRDLLANAPGDRMRYAAMGGVILTTATVAAVSGALAVNMALNLSPVWSVLVGLLWGLVIFNLDRLLVVQMVRPRSGIKQPILLAVPRLVLAIILGFVISTPLVLRIFNAEIKQELGVIHQQQYAAYTTQIDSTTYKTIPTLKSQLSNAQQVVDSGATPSVEADPDVKAAEQRLSTAEKAYEKAEHNVVCEKEGTCGSHKVGAGIAYREKVGIRDDAKKERDAAQKAVNQIRARVTRELNAANRNNLKNAHSTISTAKTQLAKLQAQRTADLAGQKKQIYADTGLLARLEALSILSARRSTLKVAHWTLFALFLSIEVLPVLTKLLQVLGPETIYDKLTASADAVTRRIHRQSDAGRLKVHRSQQRIELQLERDRARRATGGREEVQQEGHQDPAGRNQRRPRRLEPGTRSPRPSKPSPTGSSRWPRTGGRSAVRQSPSPSRWAFRCSRPGPSRRRTGTPMGRPGRCRGHRSRSRRPSGTRRSCSRRRRGSPRHRFSRCRRRCRCSRRPTRRTLRLAPHLTPRLTRPMTRCPTS